MSFKIQFIPQAAEDYTSLDGSIKKQVNEKIDTLKEDPFLGESLGNKNNIDLSGYYKIYVEKKAYRIVYRIIKDKIEIIEIWGIGKRDKMEIYKIIGQRILKRNYSKSTLQYLTPIIINCGLK
ncbi:MAG: type II toxin-antitoxin system mRNA interferase toxin, RelE/StbE family [Treponema sp.]|jgi:mRNA interferase RelE/StbE|nr:type II toxin-antitoxin system mRNA interferase toxin, RelE/StbE family [Treponema sp.]